MEGRFCEQVGTCCWAPVLLGHALSSLTPPPHGAAPQQLPHQLVAFAVRSSAVLRC